LHFRKVSARWVPRQLSAFDRHRKVEGCTKLKERLDREGQDFLNHIIKCDETWVHHFTPESKRASKQWKHADSPSILDPPTLLYNGRLPEEDLCPNQMTVEETTFCDEVYGLFSWNAEDTNESKAKRVNNPNEYMKMNSAIAEGKYEHTDANVIRNVEVRSLTLENEGGIGRDGTFQGRCNVGITRSYDVEGLDKGDDSSLSLEQLQIEETLSYEEKCKLLELLCKDQEHFVTRPGRCNISEYQFQMQGGLPKSSNSRPIPFSLQIEGMIKNGILEISHSPYVNTLTIIQRKDKPVHIRVDARQVNKQMVPDRAKTPPAHELLESVQSLL
jgi:hypothetical protein